MTTILLTGVPKVGKTDLVEITKQLSQEYYEEPVSSISLSELYFQGANRLFNTPRESVHNIDLSHQLALRAYTISEASYLLNQESSGHIIIDAPVSMFQRGGIHDSIFDADQINKLHRASGGIDYVVTVIDDPLKLVEKLHKPYPQDPNQILDWIASDVSISRILASSCNIQNGQRMPTRHLVVPRGHSDETMVKLLNDSHPTVCYFGFPITHIKINSTDPESVKEEKSGYKRMITDFRERLQEYSVMIVPMEIQDSRVTDEKEAANTVHRDLHWFVRGSDLMLAYFPTDVESKGVFEEMRQANKLGKTVILIHPNDRYRREVFGFRPTLHYETDVEFFNALENCRDPQYNNRPEAILRKLLDSYQNIPRYAHLRNYSVAADITDEQGRHLLVRIADGRNFAGHWMLPAGKREGNEKLETSHEALSREVWEETGLRSTRISADYSIYPVDYGSSPYVRIFRVLNHEGKVRADNHVKKPEIAKADFFTPQDILSGKFPLLEATRTYFQDLYAAKKAA